MSLSRAQETTRAFEAGVRQQPSGEEGLLVRTHGVQAWGTGHPKNGESAPRRTDR